MTENQQDDIEKHIEWGDPSVLTTETIDSKPYALYPKNETRCTVEFGNTGFEVHFDTEESVFNFTPQGSYYPEEVDAPKFASMLAVSLGELRRLAQSDEDQKRLGIDKFEKKEISAITNLRLAMALENLFSRSDQKDLARRTKNSPVLEKITINLEAFAKLPENDPLVVFLNKAAKRAENIQVTYPKIAR
jgi:hypothetical protein